MAGAPIPEAVVPQPVATQLGLRAGDTVQLGDEVASDRHVRPMTVRVVGVVEPLPAAGWNRDPLDGAGVNRRFFVSPRLPSATAYGPFLLPLDDLVRSGSTLDRLDVTGHPELARPARPALDAVDARFGSADPRLTAAVSARAGTERVSSALPATLATVLTEESVTGASVLVVVLLTMGLSVAALALAGRLVVALRKDETDLLGAFGASPRQLASVAGIEGGIVALVATAVAVPLAGLAHAALTRLAVVRRAGLAGTAAATPASVLVIAVGAAALAAVLVVPAVFAVTGGRADRLDRHGLLLRSGVDLLAVALAGIGLWQLRAQPPVSAGPDVVRTVAPVLCLLAGSLLVLRTVPPLLAAADARARSSPALVLPLAAIEASRRPRAAAAALLVTLGAASGCFASALLATWDAAQRDQADLRVGTDLSVTPTSPPAASQAALLADVTGGRVSPALRRNVLVGGWLGEPGAPPQLVAVDTSRAGQLLRGRAPEGRTWSEVGAGLTPADPVRGVPVAAPTSATLTGTASNGVGVSGVPRLVVQTPSGLRVGLEAAQVPFDGHAHRLVLAQPLPGGGELIAVDLQLSATANGPPAADVTSTAVTADLRLPGLAVTRQRWTARSAGIQPGRLVSPAARLDTGAGGSDVHLSAVGVAPELSDAPVDLVATAFAAPAAVPVAVSKDLAAAARLHVGGGFAMTVGTTPIPARVTQVVSDVPSVPGGPAVLADLDVVSRALLAAGDTSVAADAWWIADVGSSDAAARVRALGLGTVAGRAETAEQLAAGPLRVGRAGRSRRPRPPGRRPRAGRRGSGRLDRPGGPGGRDRAAARGGAASLRRPPWPGGTARHGARCPRAGRRRRGRGRRSRAGSAARPLRHRGRPRSRRPAALAVARGGAPSRRPAPRGGDRRDRARRPPRPARGRRPAPDRCVVTPRVHLPSVLGRARADRGPLLLAALVLALGALLACGIPAAVTRAADDAMHAAVARAGDSAALVATVPFPDTPDSAAGQREPASAALTDAEFPNTRLALPPALAAVLRTPIARVTTDPLEVLGRVAGRSLVLAYVTAQTGDPRVVWTAGRPPAASAPPTATQAVRPGSPAPKRVEVGLSQAAAEALGVRAGTRIGAQDERHEQLDLLISGVYRVGDPRDTVWAAVPHLLEPASFSDGAGQHYLAVTALLSRDSLPDARIAIDEDLLTSQVVYRADASRIGTSNADAVVSGIAQLQAAASEGLPDDARWATNLDAVVRAGQRQVAAAEGQAAALLAGLVTAAALVTALAADLLVRRRAPVLGLARVRGASLPGLGLELAVESVTLAFAGTAAGALVALALGGQAAGAWLLPLAAVGVLAAPLTGMRAASAAGGDGRRAPANRGARAALKRVRRARVLALEVALGAVAVARSSRCTSGEPPCRTSWPRPRPPWLPLCRRCCCAGPCRPAHGSRCTVPRVLPGPCRWWRPRGSAADQPPCCPSSSSRSPRRCWGWRRRPGLRPTAVGTRRRGRPWAATSGCRRRRRRPWPWWPRGWGGNRGFVRWSPRAWTTGSPCPGTRGVARSGSSSWTRLPTAGCSRARRCPCLPRCRPWAPGVPDYRGCPRCCGRRSRRCSRAGSCA